MTKHDVKLVAAAISAEVDWDRGIRLGAYNLPDAVERTAMIEKTLLEQFKRFHVEFKAAEPVKQFKMKPEDIEKL